MTPGHLFFPLKDVTLQEGDIQRPTKAGILQLVTERKSKAGSWPQEKANDFEFRQLLIVTYEQDTEPLVSPYIPSRQVYPYVRF